MNFPATNAALARAASILQRDNVSAVVAAERSIERELRAYILNDPRVFACGGVVNLLTTVSIICKSLSESDGDDWERASTIIDDVAEKVDFTYKREE